ncbi:2Fe-2S iron-sulfur cluster-binding protein [Paucibacter sp. AS339]|uniref:2Fe-2S iron-sulfur cluster-binding protein n=1 Tax=Paucibacter hankyongi TaxID=3133434 RepID=UPI0030AD6952
MKARWRIAIEGEEAPFEAFADQTILKAALQAGVGLLSSCRNGTCRACRCRLLAGEIHYLIEWPGLSAEEKAEGWILPCVAQARSDLLLRPRASEE